jgi:hypothetical protein
MLLVAAGAFCCKAAFAICVCAEAGNAPNTDVARMHNDGITNFKTYYSSSHSVLPGLFWKAGE